MSVKRLFPSILKSAAINLLARAGFHQSYGSPPVDLRGLLENPVAAIARSAGNPVLLNLPLASCRSLSPLAFKCTKSSGQPFIDTALGILDGSVTGYPDSPLERYYESFQPLNLAELLGLEAIDSGRASRLSPYAFAFPWNATPTIHYKRVKLKSVMKENQCHGPGFSGMTGWHLSGPVSSVKGVLEFERLSRTLQSIRTNGYHRNGGHDGDIVGVILVNADQYAVIISPGQHRISALVALGYNEAPIRIGCLSVSIVYRENVQSWPAVKSEFVTVEQALKVFDRVFEGRQPSGFYKKSFSILQK